MLKLAITYKDKLNKAFNNTILDIKYKYYYFENYWTYDIELSKDSWNRIELVSIDSNDNIKGFFSATISRTSDMVLGLSTINFENKNIIFAKDMYNFIVDLFEKYNFRKIEFSVIVGNPIEKMYDKYITKYGGCIVGTRKESTRLTDGKYYDVKQYEIFREDYLKHKNKIN